MSERDGAHTPSSAKASVKNLTRSAKASLELQAKSLRDTLQIVEGKLATLRELEQKPMEQKRQELFEAWDLDGDGTVDFAEMAMGLRKIQPEAMLGEAADAAIGCILQFDTDNNQRLDRQEFDTFADSLAEKVGSPFDDVVELLLLSAFEAAEHRDLAVLTLIQKEAVKEVRSAQEYAALARDARMLALFNAFDRNGDGVIDFKELAYALKKLNPSEPLTAARTAAVEAMLAHDSDSSRTLDKLEFARFITRLFLLVGQKFGPLADGLLELASAPEADILQGNDQQVKATMEEGTMEEQVFETLADRKLHMLFSIWDRNHDGKISFAELVMGLRKYASSAATVDDTAADAAEALLIFDRDADQHLDRTEFASFIITFSDAIGSDFASVADFLIMLATVQEISPAEELALLLAEDSVNEAIADVRTKHKDPDTEE